MTAPFVRARTRRKSFLAQLSGLGGERCRQGVERAGGVFQGGGVPCSDAAYAQSSA